MVKKISRMVPDNFFLGTATERCPELKPGESCHRHNTVPPGQKLLAGFLAPPIAIFYSVFSRDFPQYFEAAQERAEYGLTVAIAMLVLLWILSLYWTAHQKFTSTPGYIAAGIAAPFTLLSVAAPLIS